MTDVQPVETTFSIKLGETTVPLESSVRTSIDILRNRPLVELRNNYTRNTAALERTFRGQHTAGDNTSLPAVSDLDLKTQQFLPILQDKVFRSLVHATSRLENYKEKIKSPGLIARESGESISRVSTHSGGLDELIGNTEYVFGNSAALPSRSFHGRNTYELYLEPSKTYAVPIDIADLRVPNNDYLLGTDPFSSMGESKQYSEIIRLYSKNVYTEKDFQTFFATYCATFFDSPDQAIGFFRDSTQYIKNNPYTYWIDEIIRENSAQYFHGVEAERVQNTLLGMKKLLIEADVYPPFIPEFQFKDEVIGIKVTV